MSVVFPFLLDDNTPIRDVIPGVDARALCRRLLEEERILIAPIEGEPGSIRISTHVFNNEEELQRLLDALKREAGNGIP
jgi:selenocysteine lyase/cysteine desulfurase